MHEVGGGVIGSFIYDEILIIGEFERGKTEAMLHFSHDKEITFKFSKKPSIFIQ